MDNLLTSLGEESLQQSLQQELARFRGRFRIDPARISSLPTGGQLIGPCFERDLRNWATQLIKDEDRSVERRHFVVINSLEFGVCQAVLDLSSLENQWYRPPLYVALCPYSALNAACNTLLTSASEYLDWRFAPAEALETHIAYCVGALGLTRTSKTEVVDSDKVYTRPYGAAFELIMDNTDRDLSVYFNLSSPPFWKSFGLSLGNAGSVQLAFVEDERWAEPPYSQSLIYSGLCAFCRPAATNERRAIRDMNQWLGEYRQLQGRSRRRQAALAKC
jgi:hypothetical protein